ncbi:hypothetical protein [Novacetimonas hansenii]|uniref:hypothetical protein n=1 Tax=Novacetimonas hansenii TaxID=436 RepID=UPI000ACC8B85|nr:hypothetical protein [Novacetimonas hansenii]
MPPFDRNRRRLLKLFRKSFTKNFYDFRMLLILTFQTVSQGFRAGVSAQLPRTGIALPPQGPWILGA